MMERVAERLEAAGLLRYEISSFARPGFEAVHNARYWERRPVLGLGLGAWTSDSPGPGAPFGARRGNVRALGTYLECIESGAPAEAETDVPAEGTARGEAAFLALRTRRGLGASSFSLEFGAPPRAFWGAAIDELRGRGLVSESAAGDLQLTRAGWLLADSVFERFV
jgi:oxygen-independent coproporphyrinogen-3 oxidase